MRGAAMLVKGTGAASTPKTGAGSAQHSALLAHFERLCSFGRESNTTCVVRYPDRTRERRCGAKGAPVDGPCFPQERAFLIRPVASDDANAGVFFMLAPSFCSRMKHAGNGARDVRVSFCFDS